MTAPKPGVIRVIIADDHPVVSDGIATVLARDPGVTVVATARSFHELDDLLHTAPADVLLLDLSGMGGPPLPTLNAIRREHPHLAVVIFSASVERVREMIKAGASGYVAKEELGEQVLHAIHAAARRQQFLSPRAYDYFTNWAVEHKEMQIAPQEVSVVMLLSGGLSTVEIADELKIDPRTVQNYIGSLMRKSRCSERTQLVDWYRNVFQP